MLVKNSSDVSTVHFISIDTARRILLQHSLPFPSLPPSTSCSRDVAPSLGSTSAAFKCSCAPSWQVRCAAAFWPTVAQNIDSSRSALFHRALSLHEKKRKD